MQTTAVSGGVRLLLRMEGLAVLLVSLLAYSLYGSGWGVFALCFFLPDLALLGYIAGPRVGAYAYNVSHSYVGPLICLAAGMYASTPSLISIGIIWIAHIGFDRLLGYGLKYSSGFSFTHLGRIGGSRPRH